MPIAPMSASAPIDKRDRRPAAATNATGAAINSTNAPISTMWRAIAVTTSSPGTLTNIRWSAGPLVVGDAPGIGQGKPIIATAASTQPIAPTINTPNDTPGTATGSSASA